MKAHYGFYEAGEIYSDVLRRDTSRYINGILHFVGTPWTVGSFAECAKNARIVFCHSDIIILFKEKNG
jgi:hypothetical protein